MAATCCLIVTLAAEVVGYAGLIRADQNGTVEELKTHGDHFVNSKIAEHSGRIVRATGDRLLVEFESPAEAVACAVELQSGIIDRNIGTSPDRRITFRIGVAVDEVARNDDDLITRAVAALPTDTLATLIKPGSEIFGDGRKTAVRLAALAEPAGICISGAVRDAVSDQLPYVFEDIGIQNLDIRTAPVRCYAMGPGSMPLASPRRQIPQSRPKRLRSAAVAAGVFAMFGVWGLALWAWLGANSSKAPVPTAVSVASQIASVGNTSGGAVPAGSTLQSPLVSAAGEKETQASSSPPTLFEIGAAVARGDQPTSLLYINPGNGTASVASIQVPSLLQTRPDSGLAGVGSLQLPPLLQTMLDSGGVADRSTGTYWSQLLRNKSEWYQTRRRSTEPGQSAAGRGG
jgi:class 3 adenylate cyclase